MSNEGEEAPAIIECCSECGSKRLVWDYESSEIVCMDCGFVMEAKIVDSGPEWRAFDEEEREKKARAGAPSRLTMHDKGLSTDIDQRDRDAYGRRVAAEQRDQIYRIRKWQKIARVADTSERNLLFALSEISKIAENLSLPLSIIETAAVIYRKSLKKNLIRGRTMKGMGAAALYIACRQCGQIRTLDDLASASGLDKKVISRSYRILQRELDFTAPSSKPAQYIMKLSNCLELNGKTSEIANRVLKVAKELKLTAGRSPTGLAAAALYVASVICGERMTQREISQAARITEVTIRNRYKELVDRLFFVEAL
ncbi:MAG: transcription initiation factor IIB [Nitrososphaerota archaeon]|nr:transcription initiation factor IIB [Candidatus Bathyarchaeota archaeon]MDW8049320.1 transcription initiation factor IIB [Nitrososphaerota archaeon]